MTFRAIGAIRDAERSIKPGAPADPALIKRIIEVIEMQDNQEFFKKYYTDEGWAALEDRRVWEFIRKAQAARR